MEEQDLMTLPAEGGDASEPDTNPMAALLDEECGRSIPRRGEVREGTIVKMSPSEIIVDIGCKSEGIVTARDLEHVDPEYRASLKVGDTVLRQVVRPEDAQGNILLSLGRAQLEGDWRKAAKLFEDSAIIEEPVTGCNRGGAIINVGRVRGFAPASRISSIRIPANADDAQREEFLSQLVGKTLRVKIIELDRRRNRLILSEKVAAREWRQAQKERLLEELQEGEVRRGVVSSLCDFGAFVDLGGADGLVHLSELSWRRVGHPKQVLEVGQEVDVFVLGVDRERRRIALSIKRLKPEPWDTIEEQYHVGDLVTGTITKLASFGAFARLDEDIEGLVHISELSDEHVERPGDVVHEGQELELRVIRIDSTRHHLGLSLRQAQESQPADQEDAQAPDEPASVEGEQEVEQPLDQGDVQEAGQVVEQEDMQTPDQPADEEGEQEVDQPVDQEDVQEAGQVVEQEDIQTPDQPADEEGEQEVEQPLDQGDVQEAGQVVEQEDMQTPDQPADEEGEQEVDQPVDQEDVQEAGQVVEQEDIQTPDQPADEESEQEVDQPVDQEDSPGDTEAQ